MDRQTDVQTYSSNYNIDVIFCQTFVKDMKLGLNAKYEIHIFNGIYFLPYDCFKGLMGKLMTAKIASCAKGCVTGVPCIE